ncbi:hypothetical protein A5781_00070 [Mycobacterium sp. 852002-30065_SCH5024008]|nr:hypothetical protein A5781_00070 [Mycobacterium sp. 852002-30065_SCH5024008]
MIAVCERCAAELRPENDSGVCAECRLELANEEPSDERWRFIPGFPSHEVSDHGRVRKILRQHPSEGYPAVTLRERGRPAKRVRVHTLVLLAFRGPRPDGMEALHRDDIGWNNRLSNLRWGSRSENVRDRARVIAERLADLEPGEVS